MILAMLLFLLPVASARDVTTHSCVSDLIRITKDGAIFEKMEHFCFNPSTHGLVSANCHDLTKCAARVAATKKSSGPLYSSRGNPAFTACILAGGAPQIVEVHYHKKWYRTDRCLFTKDRSFLNAQQFLK